MKRNKLLRASAALLVLTLITSCFVGGTFAKYVSKAGGTDTARVAKWGVVVEVEEAVADIFKESYSQEYINLKATGDTVISSTKMNVLAPGTEGTLGTTTISGEPEVTVRIETQAEVTVSNWDITYMENDRLQEEEFYCPLIFTITDGKTGEKETINGLTYTGSYSTDNAAGFKTALEGAIEDAYRGDFAANTNLSEALDEFNISWEWPYQGSGETGGYSDGSWAEQQGQTDIKDTALGDKAAAAFEEGGSENDAPQITIKLTTTVTQVD